MGGPGLAMLGHQDAVAETAGCCKLLPPALMAVLPLGAERLAWRKIRKEDVNKDCDKEV